MRVVIDGVEYVPAREVVLDQEKLIESLVTQYMGDISHWTASKLDRLYDDLYVVVTEDSDNGERESLREFIARIARK